MISTRLLVWCDETLCAGEPLSHDGEYTHGSPIVSRYNGKNYCGVSLTHVMDVDDYYEAFNTTVVGGRVTVSTGNDEVSIACSLFGTPLPELVRFNSFISPDEDEIWVATEQKIDTSVAQVIRIRGNYVDVRLI
jgi:hypothetical protein